MNYYLRNRPNGAEDHEVFRLIYAALGLQRNLRILGIFARLTLRDGKPQYLRFMPRVMALLQRNLTHPKLSQIADILLQNLPMPTDAFLNELKRKCPTR